MSDTIQQMEVRIPTEVIGSETADDIIITQKAIDKVIAVKNENNIGDEMRLRIGAQSGSCSGMQYVMGFDDKENPGDKVVELDSMSVIIDNKSLFYLMGVTLDYKETEHGSGFVFNNPNNVHSCGCGGGGHHH
jgi:iron-sulfur cluster assembly protein